MNRVKILHVFLVVFIVIGLAYGAVTKLTKVAILNSTVDSTAIGSVTPSTGAFTTVSTSSTLAAGGTITAPNIVTTSGLITNLDTSTIGATTPAAGTFTTLKVSTGLTNSGVGFKHVRQASCTTPTGTFGFCQTTVTWPGTAFADTNYTAACSLDANATATVQGTSGKTTAGILVIIYNTNSNTIASSGILNCIAIHD